MRVVVIGDAMLDSYLEGYTNRLVPRGAGAGRGRHRARKQAPGGAANTAVNVHALGGQVTFLSVIGER